MKTKPRFVARRFRSEKAATVAADECARNGFEGAQTVRIQIFPMPRPVWFIVWGTLVLCTKGHFVPVKDCKPYSAN